MLFLRCWLFILAGFELIEMYNYLILGNPVHGLAINLANAPAEKRLWCFMLTLLVISRLTALAAPRSAAALFQLAAVHVAEAVYFGFEYLLFAAHCEPIIFAIIVANALGFTALAVASPSSEAGAKKKKGK